MICCKILAIVPTWQAKLSDVLPFLWQESSNGYCVLVGNESTTCFVISSLYCIHKIYLIVLPYIYLIYLYSLTLEWPYSLMLGLVERNSWYTRGIYFLFLCPHIHTCSLFLYIYILILIWLSLSHLLYLLIYY